MKKKILLVGSTSNLGQTLYNYLSNHNLFTMGRSTICDYHFDALNERLDETVFDQQFDVIVNTVAAFGSVDTSCFYETEKINALGILKLCEIAKKCKVKHFVQISSLFTLYEPGNIYYNIYSVSKKHADELLKLFCFVDNIRYTILKPSQIYSNDIKAKKHQNFLYAIGEKVINSEDIYINGTNDPVRNYIHIEDVCELIRKVIEREVYGEFVCSAIESTSMSVLIDSLKKATNSKSNVIFDSSKPNIQSLPEIVDYKLYDILKWKPQKSIKININDFVKGIKNG